MIKNNKKIFFNVRKNDYLIINIYIFHCVNLKLVFFLSTVFSP